MKTIEHLAWEFLKKRMLYLMGFAGNRSRNEPFYQMMVQAEDEAKKHLNERGEEDACDTAEKLS